MSEETCETCETCRFWRDMDDVEFHRRENPTVNMRDLLGECCKRAPKAAGELGIDDLDPCRAVWPVTHPDEWCGEYQKLAVRNRSPETDIAPEEE